MITCTRRIQFCAGHRVHGHENKCKNLHGHNYVALFTARAKAGYTAPDGGVDGIGRIIDFSAMKGRLGGWIDEHWDHGFIAWQHDDEVAAMLIAMPEAKRYFMPTNPTAENMARHLLFDICPKLFADTQVAVVQIVIHETENCSACATLDD